MLGQHWDKHAHMDTYKKSLETRDLSFFNIQTDTQFEQDLQGKRNNWEWQEASELV